MVEFREINYFFLFRFIDYALVIVIWHYGGLILFKMTYLIINYFPIPVFSCIFCYFISYSITYLQSSLTRFTETSKINITPKGVHLSFSKLHSILALSKLLLLLLLIFFFFFAFLCTLC